MDRQALVMGEDADGVRLIHIWQASMVSPSCNCSPPNHQKSSNPHSRLLLLRNLEPKVESEHSRKSCHTLCKVYPEKSLRG